MLILSILKSRGLVVESQKDEDEYWIVVVVEVLSADKWELCDNWEQSNEFELVNKLSEELLPFFSVVED